MRVDLKAGVGSGTCRSCQAPVIWVKSSKGKNVPIDGDELEITNIAKGGWVDLKTEKTPDGRFVCHFATCPNADEHRRNG